MAEYIVAETLSRFFSRPENGPIPRVLDPACGDGEFLIAAEKQLRNRFGSAAATSVFGVERDKAAAIAARQRAPIPPETVLIADALSHDFSRPFDVIVGNPPYVNIRELTKSAGESHKEFLRARFRTARGAFDLYVVFLERAFELLRPGGYCGLIVPNKLATLEYATACRELLGHETTLELITDVSSLGLFPDADVYPYIVVWRKEPPTESQHVSVFQARDESELVPGSVSSSVLQSTLQARAGWRLHGELDVESLVPTEPLGRRATLLSGTTGFLATKIAEQLVERTAVTTGFPFITSGNIDRFSIRSSDVRFMGRRFANPILPRDAVHLTDGKRRVFESPKLVFSGMGQRLEAAFDPGGFALGVQVFAATDFADDPYFLLGVLNSRLMSRLFRLRYQAKRLAGGYLSVNKGQLSELPIRVGMHTDSERDLQLRIALLARRQCEIVSPEVDDEIDRLVERLYGVHDDPTDDKPPR